MITKTRMTPSAAALARAGAAFHTKEDGGSLDVLMKSFGEHTDEVMKRLGASTADVEGVKSRLSELEKKQARMKDPADYADDYSPSGRGVGSIVAKNEEIKSLSTEKGRVKVDVKSITSAPDSAGAMVRPDRDTNITMLPHRRLTIRDLMGPGRTSSNSVEYIRQTGFTNNAATVAEGTLKPQSNITSELLDAKVRTIAHWVEASRQILDDAPMLESMVDGELRYGLQLVEEQQLLRGDGVGQNLHGMIPQATEYQTTRNVAGDTRFDTLLHAMEQAELAELPATGIVVNTSDWYSMLGIKDADGNYISGGPLADVPARIWRLPVVASNSMAPGEFLVGSFRTATQIYDRWDATVLVSTEDRDVFVRNMVTVLAEQRLAMAVKRPEAIIYGMFPA